MTNPSEATCGTIRLKLLKIGALVRISVRRIKIAMASACPAAQDWGRAAIRLAIAAIARASPAGHAPPRRDPRGTNQLAHGEPKKQTTARPWTPRTCMAPAHQPSNAAYPLRNPLAEVESRRGAVAGAMRHRPVSPPRSSNRTCRTTASGFPTGFIVGHTAGDQDVRGVDAAHRVRQRHVQKGTPACRVLAPCAV